MRSSGRACHPTQSARRQRRHSFWEEQNVPDLAYADEEEWQKEEWTDDDDLSLLVQEEGEADDSLDDEASDYSEEKIWEYEADEDDGLSEERGLVALRSGQADYLIEQIVAQNGLVAHPYRLEPETLVPVFIAGNRKVARMGALGHSPLSGASSYGSERVRFSGGHVLGMRHQEFVLLPFSNPKQRRCLPTDSILARSIVQAIGRDQQSVGISLNSWEKR